MAYSLPTGLGGPYLDENAQRLLYKIAAYIAAVVAGDKGFLVRGTVSSSPVTLTDGSGTITSGGSSQQVFAANTDRRYLLIQNVSDTDMWVNFGTAATGDQPSVKILAGGNYEPLVPSSAAVNVIGATTGKKFVAKQG